jgi:hypothetical protein
VQADGSFAMFRRAKLMLDRIDPHLVAHAEAAGELVADVVLTDAHGCPTCARVDPPMLVWSVPSRPKAMIAPVATATTLTMRMVRSDFSSAISVRR